MIWQKVSRPFTPVKAGVQSRGEKYVLLGGKVLVCHAHFSFAYRCNLHTANVQITGRRWSAAEFASGSIEL